MARTMFCLLLGPLVTSYECLDLRKYPPNLLNTWINKCMDKWINMLEIKASNYHNYVSHIPGPGVWMTVIKIPIFIMSLFTSHCYRSLVFYTTFFYLRMWKNCSSPSRRGSMSVWCVFCSTAVLHEVIACQFVTLYDRCHSKPALFGTEES